MMSIAERIARGERMLAEGSVYELLRRDPRIAFDPQIAHGGLIYEPESREILAGVHRSYLDIARVSGLPMLAFTDTWRASASRIAGSRFAGRRVNRDNVTFLRTLASESGAVVFIAGMSGPHGDAYRPEEAPSRSESAAIHRPQIDELAESGADVLFAATLPALDEAIGIAQVMAATGKPWMLSFVVRRDGMLLDRSPLEEAILGLDAMTSPRALGFSINCVHPLVAAEAMTRLEPSVATRIIAFQGNASKLAPEELDGRADLEGDDPGRFAAALEAVEDRVPIVGGCCGTSPGHIAAVASRYRR